MFDTILNIIRFLNNPSFWIGAGAVASISALVIVVMLWRLRRMSKALRLIDREMSVSSSLDLELSAVQQEMIGSDDLEIAFSRLAPATMRRYSIAENAAPQRDARLASVGEYSRTPKVDDAHSLIDNWVREQDVPIDATGLEDIELPSRLDERQAILDFSMPPARMFTRKLDGDISQILEHVYTGEMKEALSKVKLLEPSLQSLKDYQNRAEQFYSLALDALRRKHHLDCSIFAPPVARRGEKIVIQALLHLRRHLVSAAKLAVLKDPSANRRAFATLDIELRIGTEVEFFIDCPTIEFEKPFASVVWQGGPEQVAFSAVVPSDHSIQPIRGTLHVSVSDIPVGEIEFSISVAEKTVKNAPQQPLVLLTAFPEDNQGLAATAIRLEESKPAPVATNSTKFERAFISYSRKDFETVSFFAQGLEERGLLPVMDITALEPGVEWAKELPAKIESADVFYIVWSDNAALSKWVDIECRHAIASYDQRKGKRPKIKPIPLHQPWPQAPKHLSRFHFDLKWQAHRTAQKKGLTHSTSNVSPKITSCS